MQTSFKIQNIAPPETEKGVLVITHEFTPPNEIAIKKRGHLFITLKIRTSGDFDPKETAKLFLETIQENFYRITDETPLHALEKSLERSYKIIQTAKINNGSSPSSNDVNLQISFATALIWNRVLYTSYLGDPAIYLIRGSGVRKLTTNPALTEIWTNSGILDDEDVLIIGTDSFAKEFPAQEVTSKLGSLSQNVALSPLKNELGAMLIKIDMEDKTKGQIHEKMKGLGIRDYLSSVIWKAKNKISENESLSDRFKMYQNKKSAPVSSINGLLTNASPIQNSGPASTGPRRISKSKTTRKKRTRAILGLLMVCGIGYLVYSMISGNFRDNSEEFTNNQPETIVSGESNIMGATNQIPEIEDLHPIFLDIRQIENSIIPAGISSTNNHIYILDLNSKQVFQVDIETTESKAVTPTLDNPQYIRCNSEFCYVAAGEGFYGFDPRQNQDNITKTNLEIGEITDIQTFGANLYYLADNSIYFSRIPQTSTSEWIRGEIELNNPKSFVIDGNIYVLEDRNITKYRDGVRQTDFEISDQSRLLNPTKITMNGDSLMVFDAIRRVIVVYDKNTAEFIEEIELVDQIEILKPSTFTLTKGSNRQTIFEKDRILYKVNAQSESEQEN